jgi:CBS domain-containing protein
MGSSNPRKEYDMHVTTQPVTFVRQLMSQPVITCRRTDSLNHAARLMWEHNCGVLPVVDDGGHLVGIVTDRDICMASYTQGKTLHGLIVHTAMAQKVHACHRDDAIEVPEKLMSEHQVRRIPVVDDAYRPVGVISITDIALAMPPRAEGGMAAEVAQTLAAICEPRGRAIARPEAEG